MKKRIRKKYAAIDASGVKEIARMQEYITDLENYIWCMAMAVDGKDNAKSVIKFTEPDSTTEWAVNKIYKFITDITCAKKEIKQ